MVLVETSFPRGGTTKPSTSEKSDIVFGARQNKRKSENLTKKQREQKRKQEALSKDDNVEALSAELLSHKTIQEGMLIMGCVKTIDPTFIKISLPGRIYGKVLASSVSEAYSKVIAKYVENKDLAKEFKPLDEIFHVGQTVYTKVIEIVDEKGKLDIKLSLKPSDVHSHLHHENIRKGMLLNAAVSEAQEHGFVIETGIKNLRSFLPSENKKHELYVGQLITVKIEKFTQSSGTSTAVCKLVSGENRKIKDLIEPQMDYILPSTVVKFTITKIFKDGLSGTIMNGAFRGYINEHQLNEPIASPDDFEVNSTVNARLLYVMPLTKLCYLSLNIKDFAQDEIIYKKGDIIDEATVYRTGTGGVILNLGNNCKGLISFKTMKSNFIGNYDQDELLSKYRKNSKHKVRVTEYDQMDSLYICTDNPKNLNEKYYTITDFKIGELTTGVVTGKDKYGSHLLSIGVLQGLLEKNFAAHSATINENSKVKCRIMATNVEKNLVYLTNKTEYMSKTANLLTNLTQAKPNKIFLGTIVKCYDNYFLVKFFNNIKGVLYKNQIAGFLNNETSSFFEGQTMHFRIVSKTAEKITLGLPENRHKIGEICHVRVTNVIANGLEISFDDDNELKGLIPVRLLTDYPDLVTLSLKTYCVDDVLDAGCIIKNIFSLRDVEYFQNNPPIDWRSVQPGDIIRAFIKNVEEDIIELMLPIRHLDKLVRVHLKMFLHNFTTNPNIVVVPDQVVYVKVIGKEQMTKTLSVSAKLTDVFNGDLSVTAEYCAKYLQELNRIKRSFKKRGKAIGALSLGEKVTGTVVAKMEDSNDIYLNLDDGVTAIIGNALLQKNSKMKIGAQLECVILWIDYLNETVFVSHHQNDVGHIALGRKLPENYRQKVVNVKVLVKNKDVCVCSMKKGPNPLVIMPRRLHYNDFANSIGGYLKEGDFCRVAFIHDELTIAIPESDWKLWKQISAGKRKHDADCESDVPNKKMKLGKVEAQRPVVSFMGPYVPLMHHININKFEKYEDDEGLFFTDTSTTQRAKTSKKSIGSTAVSQKSKKVNHVKIQIDNAENSGTDDGEAESIGDESEVDSDVEEKSSDTESPENTNEINPDNEVDVQNDSDVWRDFLKNQSTDRKLQKAVISKKVHPVLPGASGFWSNDLTSSQKPENTQETSEEDDDDEDRKAMEPKKKKKLTQADRVQAAREEEARLRRIEEQYADPNMHPQTADQFDRLVLATPNNSIMWINYMVFHLQATEIDKARSVARKALKSISFREEQELLNVWVALLNLELRYGTKESFNDCFKESVLCNDPYKVYTRCLQILSDAKKTQELGELILTATKKFKDKPDIWKNAASAYFEVGLPEKGKALLHKALNSLPDRDHINTIVSFANLHYKHGDKETAYALYEQIITSYPKRVDVWSQYVDILIKDDEIHSARQTLERAISQKIPIKKMRTLFKKFLEFEEKFGTDENVQKVKEAAANFVKSEVGTQ